MRKHLLRILTVMLLVCLGAFGFAACGGNEEEETTYTLTYTANGGVGEDREEHYKEGETVTVKANPFTRDDYTFTTWKEEGTSTEHAPSSAFTMPAHDVTFAAQWEEDTPEPSDDIEGVWSVSSGDYVGFTVTVDVRENTAHVILLKNAADSNFVCMYLPFTKGQDGTYSLNGATLSLDGENLVYDTGLPGQSMTFTTKAPLPGALAITGVKYAVHQGVTVMHDVVEIDFGATPAIKHNGTAATGVKAIEAGGYKIFTGTVDTAPITVIAFRLDSHDYAAVLMGDSNKDRFDLVDTAPKFTVTYEQGEASGEAENMPDPVTETYEVGASYQLSDKTPTWEGHTFKGWKANAGETEDVGSPVGGSASGPLYQPNGTYKFATPSNVTFVAQWEAGTSEQTYTVTFDVGTNGSSANAQQVTGKKAGESVPLPTVTANKGYTFTGWYKGSNKVAEPTAQTYPVSAADAEEGTIALTAHYDLISYTVKFDVETTAAGGSVSGAHADAAITITDRTVTFPAGLSLGGYTLKGWKLGSGNLLTGSSYEVTEAELPENSAKAEITFVAQWQLESEGVWTGKLNIGGDGDPVDATIYIKAAETGYKVKNEEQSETAVAFAVVSFEMQLGGPEAAKVAAAAFVTIKENAVLLVVPMMEGNITLTVSEGNLVLTPQGVEGSPSPSTFTAGGVIPAEEKLSDGTLYGYDASGLYGMELTVAESGAKVTVKGDASAEEGDQDCQVYYIGSYAILLHDTSKAEAEAEYELDLVLVKDEGGYLCFVGDENYTIVSEAPVTLTLEKGEGTLLNGAERKYKKGTEITISELTSDVTPPEGYTFKEWQKDGVAYSEETLKLDATTTLTAVYEPKKPTVQFQGDGTGELSVTLTWNGDSKKWEGNLPAAIVPSDDTDFVDWKIDANGSVSNKNASEKLELDPGDYTVTITANTKQPDQVTVTFQWADGDTTTKSVDKNGSVTLPTDKQGRKPGYTLKGWKVSGQGDDQLIRESTYTVGSDPVTLVAVWELMKPEITVEKGGSESEVATPEPVWQQESNNYKITLPTETPELDGKRFDGWEVTGDGVDTSTQAQGYVTVTLSDNMTVTFTAKWVDVYGVTYDDGVEDDPAVEKLPTDGKKYAKDESVKIDETEPTREGYDFKGWKVNATEDIKQAGESVNMTEGGLTLTAQWDVHKNNVNYVLGDDASWDDELPTTVETAFGTSVTLPKAPKRTGYTFTGWKIEGGELNGTKQPNETFTMPDAEVTVTAQWNKDDVLYTFNFYENKDDPEAKTTKTETLADGKTISDDTANTEITKTNYTFDGWFYEKDGTEHEFNNTFVPSDYGDTTIKVYAKWTLNDTYVIGDFTGNGWAETVEKYPEPLKVGDVLTLTGGMELLGADGGKNRWDGVQIALSTTNFTDRVAFAYDWRVNGAEAYTSKVAKGYLTITVNPEAWTDGLDSFAANGTGMTVKAVVTRTIETLVQVVYTITGTLSEKEETFSVTYNVGVALDAEVMIGVVGDDAKLTNGQIVRTTETMPEIADTQDETGVKIGTTDTSLYGTDTYSVTLKAGQTLTVKGNLLTSGTANLSGFGVEMVPYGVANIVKDNSPFNFRLDNACTQADEWVFAEETCTKLNLRIAKAYTHSGEPESQPDEWLAFVAAKKDIEATTTIAWTEADKIVVTFAFANSKIEGYTSGYTRTQTYTVTPMNVGTHLAKAYTFTFSPDGGYIKDAKAQITYSPIGG